MKRRARDMLDDALQILAEAVRGVLADGGVELSGHLAFMTLIALFPFLICLAALAGTLGNAANGERFVRFMLEFVPRGIPRTLQPGLKAVFSNTQSGTLTLSALFALWMASNGIEAMRMALDRAYRLRETRSFIRRRLQSMGLVLSGALAIAVLSIAVLPAPLLWSFVTRLFPQSPAELAVWEISRYALAGGVTFAALLVSHLWLPNADHRPRQVLPGVALTIVLLLGATVAFSLFLQGIARYDVVYGSLGGVVATLVYLYINALAFVFGAEFNAALFRWNRPRA